VLFADFQQFTEDGDGQDQTAEDKKHFPVILSAF
jgi:hypothetical protein